MADYKAVTITGGAINDLGLPVKRRTRKAKGGSEEQSDPLYKNASIMKVGGGAALMPVSTPPAQATPSPVLEVKPPTPSVTSVPSVVQQGGKPIKVELKKKVLSKKVMLHPKKNTVKDVKDKTKKSRKFILGVSSMHKRMTRAKKMQHTVKKMPLDALRKQLIQAKLIKESSKAPEAILRQIASDSELVGKKML